MTHAKPTVATDAGDTLGKIITANEKRDAIHLAVENVTAGMMLMPGQPIRFYEAPGDPLDGAVIASDHEDAIGIVDPFLVGLVRPGQRFWLVVMPRQISSLRHVWEHPSFPASGETDKPADPISTSMTDEILRARRTAEIKAELSPSVEEAEANLREFIENSDLCQIKGGYDAAVEQLLRSDWDVIVVKGSDAGGDIPDVVWQWLEVMFPDARPVRATSISCSC